MTTGVDTRRELGLVVAQLAMAFLAVGQSAELKKRICNFSPASVWEGSQPRGEVGGAEEERDFEKLERNNTING